MAGETFTDGVMGNATGTIKVNTFCAQLGITPDELRARLAFLSFCPDDQRNLREIGEVIRAHVDEIIAAFYDHLRRFDELRGILSEPGLMERLTVKQREYLLSLGQTVDGLEYAEGRLRIGFVHERVGLKQKWYLGAYSKFFELIVRHLTARHAADAPRLVSLILTVDKLLRFDEIFVVDTYYHSTTQRLADSLQELNLAHHQLIEISRLDPLTGASNRRALMEMLELELRRCRRYRHSFALLFLDVDRFKSINDRYGHACGDRVLQQLVDLAGRLIRPPDMIGRYGGEEFAIGLVECDREGARQIAERIRLAVEQSSVLWKGRLVPVTVSIGVAMLTPDVTRVEALIDRADKALYRAKAAGRNRTEMGSEAAAA